jgi:quinohemoprotein ethanol dehydrogenase
MRKAHVLSACLLLSLGVHAPAHAAKVPAANWPNPGNAYDESGYSPLAGIDRGNVGKLGLAWSLDLEGERTLEATPLAVDGVIYFSGSYAAVYAVQAASGKLLWKYDPETWKHHPAKMGFGLPVNRGTAYAAGKVFVAALDGRLIALDASSGKEIWSVETVPADMMNVSTGAPRVFDGKVIIGNSGADFGARGFVTAYDQASGKQLWRFFTVPGSPEDNKGNPAMERAAATWGSNAYWKSGSGGTVWNGITYDPELKQIYIGVGNGGPYDPDRRSPGGGDNLYLSSIVALDADSGEYRWHYQTNPREGWDYKCTANMITATLTIDGKPRKVLMQAPTNGFFYVLDRENGKLISAEKIGKVNWAERIDLQTGRPVEMPNLRYETGEVTIFPGSLGAHNFQAMSYSPRTGLVYIPYMQLGSRYVKGGKPEPGAFAFNGLTLYHVRQDAEDGKGALLAWDPVAQKARWKFQHEQVWNGGTLATAGDLVFQGTADGYFAAYDADSGKPLWKFNAGLGVLAAPMSFSSGGKQYVSVLVGYGGSAAIASEVLHVGWKYNAQPRRLLTFALGGKAALAATPPADLTVRALDDPSLQIDEADVAAGRATYTLMCSACHGLKLRSPGAPGPDLRESPMTLRVESMKPVLKDGALMSRGMPKFGMLSDKQIQQLHAYIRAGAHEALGTRPPSDVPVGAGGG